MNIFKTSSFLLLILLLSSSSCASQSSDSTISREVKNLIAFSKIYGYVKYFHPSDEAREINWDKFAIHGVKTVKNARNQKELKESLDSLFSPVAPTLSISPDAPSKSSFSSYLKNLDQDTATLQTVAWQHLGVDLNNTDPTYASRRVNIFRNVWDNNIILFRLFKRAELKGKRFQLSATVTSDFKGEGELFIVFDNKPYTTALIVNQSDLTCTSEDWTVYKVQAEAGNNVYQGPIGVGVRLKGTGNLWIRDVSLKTQNEGEDWKVIFMDQSMATGNHSGLPAGWELGGRGGYYNHAVETDCPAHEGKSLRISSYPQLFERYPRVGETVVSEISDGLWSEVPLALYRNEEHTLPRSNIAEFEELQRQLNAVDWPTVTADDESVRIANVVITWNIFQHFYLYFDVIDTDWERQLSLSLQRALADRTTEDFYVTLQKMLATLQDGHITVHHPSVQNSARFPFLVDWIENQVVVTHSKNDIFAQFMAVDGIRRGDIILSVDGIPAGEIVRSNMELISGSPQYKRYQSLKQFGLGEK